jgi:uncharacterized protein (UPF0333 family)
MLGKKGQSTLEYVLVLSAIIAAIIFATITFMRPRLQTSMNHVTNQMANQIQKIRF